MANDVLIGKKNVMSYVLACMTLFQGGAKTVTIKARGRAISRAVDVAEIIRNRFVTEAKVSKITVGTQELTNPKTKRLQGVSTIEIVLSR